VQFSADGRRIGCRTAQASMVLDATGGEPVRVSRSRPPAYLNAPFTAALTLDGSAAVVCENVSTANQAGGHRTRIDLWPLSDPGPKAARWSLTVERVIHDEPLFLPGDQVVTLERGVNLQRRRWETFLVARDLSAGRELWSTPPSADGPTRPTASADGRLIAAWHTRHLTVWRTDDLTRPPVVVKNEGTKHYTAVAVHPSGRSVAATSNDTTVKVYETQTWQVARSFAWEIGRLRSVAFSPDGCRAAAGSDRGRIVLWDVDL
jgi:hypothetical protein